MVPKIQILPLTLHLYHNYKQLVQNTQWGNPMLPQEYSSSLWGCVILIDEVVIGGWVGVLKGNLPIIKAFTKSVYFDSYPIFATQEIKTQFQDKLLDVIKLQAKNDHIIMLHLTHWVRGKQLRLDVSAANASFITPLHATEDGLWKLIDSKQRNCVRKGEKNGVEYIACHGKDTLQYLSDFQKLRQQTQQHAISKNAQVSMLLKSDEYFKELFLNPNTRLFAAMIEGKVAAVALMILSGKTVYYYSGGSDYELNKKYSCSAFLIWKAICYFNQYGLDFFDMGGVPVSPSKEHPAYGVYAFKRSFGGEYTEFDGGDIIISRWKYKFLNWILSQRKILRFFSTKI